MAEKAIVCACEDVAVHDIERAIALGHSDIESVKRYTGLGTGPCQGKSCLTGCMKLCAKAGLPPEELAAARLRLVPAVRLLRLQNEVAAVWKALEAGEPAPPPRAAPSPIVVWRKQFEVLHAPLPADEASALERAQAGQMLGEICEAFADRPDATEAALAAVGSWFAEQWIARKDK